MSMCGGVCSASVKKRCACLVLAARVLACLVVTGVQAVVGGGARARIGLRPGVSLQLGDSTTALQALA